MSIVRSAVIYGANASGKSNVLKALDFYKRFIIDSFKNSQAGESIEVEVFYREDGNTTVYPKSSLLQELVNKKLVRDNVLLLSTAA